MERHGGWWLIWVLIAVPACGQISTRITYQDVTGETRELDVYVRVPAESSGALPVVIWSHDGAVTGAARDVMAEWGETTAKAGYVSVTVVHPVRDLVQHAVLCRALRLDREACLQISPVDWDWPNDLRQVISSLEAMNAPAARIDLRRIALAGHGDGSNGVISLAGARRLLTSTKRAEADDFTDRRPVAFVCLSPQGPINAGFFDYDLFQRTSSWMGIERPVLSVTGSGDNNCDEPGTCRSGDTPSRRRVSFDLMAGGDKYLMFVNSVRMPHPFLGSLDTGACTDAAACAQYGDWLRTTVLAFLDAYVKNSAEAKAWLRDGGVRASSGDVVEWRSK